MKILGLEIPDPHNWEGRWLADCVLRQSTMKIFSEKFETVQYFP